jgi:hypothetical protein
VMLTNVTIILGEELAGPHATPHPLVVLATNAPWVVVPLYIIVRMGRSEHPFSTRFEPASQRSR